MYFCLAFEINNLALIVMKVIVLYNNYPTTALNDGQLDVCVLPDTCLLKDGKPFFIPDFAMPCVVGAHLVVRICRLGRSISERFAHRYYDAVTIGATFSAEALRKQLVSEGRPWDIAVGFDGAAAIGKFQSLYDEQQKGGEEEAGVNQHFQPLSADHYFALANNDVEIHTGVSGNMLHHVDRVIAQISKHYTLRQGDLIFTGMPDVPREVQINDRITGSLNGETLLRFNVK